MAHLTAEDWYLIKYFRLEKFEMLENGIRKSVKNNF